MYRHERHHLDTLLAHTLKEATADVPTTHIIVDQLYRHAFMCLVDQGIGHQTAQCILGKDVHVDMDMIFGILHVGQ